MSRYFPHTAYTEDQPLSRTILYTHTLTRGLQTGALVGVALVGVRQVVPRLRQQQQQQQPLARQILRASSTGSLVGLGLIALATAGRMKGRQEIEWKDRSWRLMENQGQLDMDDWTYSAMAVAAAAAVAGGQVKMMGWRALVGSLGIGGALGMLGSAAWTTGVKSKKLAT